MSKEPFLGNAFATSTVRLARLCRVTYDVAKLNIIEPKVMNQARYMVNDVGGFYWKLVIPVPVETMEVSDQELARSMILAARAILDDRLAALEPKDGIERVEPAKTPAKSQKKKPAGA